MYKIQAVRPHRRLGGINMKKVLKDFLGKSEKIGNRKLNIKKQKGEPMKSESPIFAEIKHEEENEDEKQSIEKTEYESSYREPERQKAILNIEKLVDEKISKVNEIHFEEFEQNNQDIETERSLIEEKIKERREKRQAKTKVVLENKANGASDALDVAIDKLKDTLMDKGRHAIKVGKSIKTTSCKQLCRLKPAVSKISGGMEVINDKTATFVEKVDGKIYSVEDKIDRRARVASVKIRNAEKALERNKKKVGLILAGSIAVAVVITLCIGNITAYEYMYNGKVIGIVKDQEEVYRTIDAIGDKLVYEHGAEVNIDKENDITFNRTLSIGKEIDDKDDVLNRLTYMKDINAKGYAITVEGEQVAILSSQENAESTLEKVKQEYAEGDSEKYESVGFMETVLIEILETKLGNIQSPQKAKEILLARDVGVDGEEEDPLLTVKTEEIVTYLEPLYYEIVYEDTQTKYKGESTVKLEGSNGEREVVARVTKVNGEEVAKEEIKDKVIQAPVNQVVLRGAKEPPSLVGTGTFVYPVRGSLTSRFGYRWGSFHPALDIAAPMGTPIKASDGGTVTFAGYKGSYGYLVEINHGGNRVTRYAHCSKLLVKKGDKVFQGMHIANVGSTGDSTGPHVHFEVLINGVNKNPLSYL